MKVASAVAALLGSASLTFTAAVDACCTASRPGIDVQIADQEILIVYDGKTGTEHFVRRASFDTQAKDFGFLVPTPTVPELAEASSEVFDRLHDVARPEVRHRTDYRIGAPALLLLPFWITKGSPMSFDSRAVRVLHEQRVAGYDAVVLEADDAKALADWLRSRGYSTRPALEDWLVPYVQNKWKVTAFKYALDSEKAADDFDTGVSTSSVRMSFATDEPFFPYRVPTDQRGGRQGLLRVFYVGDRRMTGVVGPEADPWVAETKFSDRVETMPSLLRGAIPSQAVPAGAWLTAFEDHRWPGGSADLFFVASPDASPVIPAPVVIQDVVEVFLPLDVAAAGVGLWWWVRRRRRRAAS